MIRDDDTKRGHRFPDGEPVGPITRERRRWERWLDFGAGALVALSVFGFVALAFVRGCGR